MKAPARKKVQTGIKHAAVLGLIYALMDVVVVATLFTDVACGCEDGGTDNPAFGTIACQGSSFPCKVSKNSVFVLMAAFYWICTLCMRVFW